MIFNRFSPPEWDKENDAEVLRLRERLEFLDLKLEVIKIREDLERTEQALRDLIAALRNAVRPE